MGVKTLAEHNSAIGRLTAQHEERMSQQAESHRKQMSASLRKAEREVESAKQRLQVVEEERNRLQGGSNTNCTAVQDLQKQLTDAISASEKLKRDMCKLETSKNEIQTELIKLKTSHAELENSLKTTEEKRNRLQGGSNTNCTAVQDLQKQLTDAISASEKLKRDMCKLETSVNIS